MTLESSELLNGRLERMQQGNREIANPYVSLKDLEEACLGNEILEELLRDTIEYCMRYAETVCRFEQIVLQSTERDVANDRAELAVVRTRVHDTTIESIKLLARTLRKSGKDSSWITKLVDRPAFTKFAVLTAFEKLAEMTTQSQEQHAHA
jgi:benzoyl-CoA reductase/2-hydroxyglutaryl-CoA dehydratase subunit BcrC/BadD/HgdB